MFGKKKTAESPEVKLEDSTETIIETDTDEEEYEEIKVNTEPVEQTPRQAAEQRETEQREEISKNLIPAMKSNKKKGLLARFRKQEEEYIPPVDTKLYLFTEVNKMGIVHYLRNNKIETALMSTEPNELLGAVLMEDYRSRLLIIDYGRGKFIDPDYVESIVGLVEVFADIGFITIFTNSSLMQNAVKHRFNRNKVIMERIDIRKYKGAVDVYEVLNEYNEVYTIEGATDIRPENTMGFRGVTVDTKNFEYDRVTFKEPIIFRDDTSENEEGILAYK